MGVRHFSRFSRSGLPNRRHRSTPLHAGAPRVAIFETWDAADVPTSAIRRPTFFITNHLCPGRVAHPSVLVSSPITQLWVPHPCVFCKGGRRCCRCVPVPTHVT